jgi:hypothetical protein
VQFVIVVAGGLALMAGAVLTYYVISYAVLYVVSKALPLTGRRR